MVTPGKLRFFNPRIVATSNADGQLRQAGIDYHPFITRHFQGDWGLCHPDDQAQNNEALAANYGIVMSVFEENGVRFWVHSYIGGEEAYTTVLMPEDY